MKDNTSVAVLLLGSNLGDRLYYITQAGALISNRCGIIIKTSSLYETSPWGYVNQPFFVNQVMVIETKFSAENLLKELKKIESELGRGPSEKWKERNIDIDILFYNSEVIEQQGLVIPHPMIQLRRFTLVPLQEIMPDFVHPVLHETINRLVEKCNDTGTVTLKQLVKSENA